MKKLEHIFLILGMIFVLLLNSCSKQLNVYPTTSEVDGKVIKDLQSAKTTLNGIYYRFANAGFDNNQNPSVLWVGVNEGIPSELSGLFTYPYGGSEITDHTYQSSSYAIGSVWQYGMNIVNAANGFLKNIEPAASITAEDKKVLQAEAKFLRAYANIILLAYFGQYDDPSSEYGIILRTDFVTADNISQPRSSVQEAYNLILADLDEAIAVLPDVNTDNYYANIWAAKLLKARVLMIKNNSADKLSVIELCEDIINNSPYELEKSYQQLFWSKGLESNEVILGIHPYSQDIYKYNNYIYYNQNVGTDLMLKLFKNDPRGSWILRPKPNNYMGGNMQVFTKYYSGSVIQAVPTASSSVSYALRLTEAYLLEAEAITESGGNLDNARVLLKTVMEKSGVTNFTQIDNAKSASQLQLEVIKEEMRNFVGEAGQDWFALRRLPFETIKEMVPSIGNKTQLILPIPQEEMKRNSALRGMQNPGYGG
ncbi:RagB/SusD family nutrient uptake outer membrane protein [Arachidicoccus terrestris]|uniref:RagB/SusD family nutrient uptake outer membrane protein n=1 Tax=Arachidicoccus terrestris TaxID=2875539 RepID=UPI001CC510D3|nr:RagB/SusD family nutrient uptake outer membrane protein [Arachidicoccus terrestris]UAY55206.1 RagB/SusD family nutrient uptake outer membrane protein [Arachidicoccus terrestris]